MGPFMIVQHREECLGVYETSELLFTALEGFIFIAAFALLSNRREFIFKNYIKVITFILIYMIYTYWLTLFVPRGLHTFPIVFLTLLILNYIFNGTFFKSLVKHFFTVIAISLIEIFISILGMFIMDVPIGDLLQNNFYVLICTIIAKSIELIAIFILYRSSFNMSLLNDSNPKSSRVSHILIIISSVLFFMVGTNFFISDKSHHLLLFNIFSFIIYVVLICSVVIAFREGSKLEIIQFASELKKENIQQLIEFNEMVAKERHEYKNHLNTIYGLCTLNKADLSDKIKLYINNYANNSEARNIVIDSGNDFVDAIINVKYNNALRKGIDVVVDFDVPLSAAEIEEDEAVTIISNIIENAFESIVLAQQEKKYINIQTYIQSSNYFISISNNGPMISEADKKKIFSAGFSTKDNTTKKRGFGLSIVQAQIEHCGGIISIDSTEEVTEFLITLKVREQKAVV
jgi:two-component system, LytTR family, sensor histidine kinase AgrC